MPSVSSLSDRHFAVRPLYCNALFDTQLKQLIAHVLGSHALIVMVECAKGVLTRRVESLS